MLSVIKTRRATNNHTAGRQASHNVIRNNANTVWLAKSPLPWQTWPWHHFLHWILTPEHERLSLSQRDRQASQGAPREHLERHFRNKNACDRMMPTHIQSVRPSRCRCPMPCFKVTRVGVAKIRNIRCRFPKASPPGKSSQWKAAEYKGSNEMSGTFGSVSWGFSLQRRGAALNIGSTESCSLAEHSSLALLHAVPGAALRSRGDGLH